MRERILEYLVCPKCRGSLDLAAEERDGDHVMTGSLTCDQCDADYPVLRGVPRMAPEQLSDAEDQTVGAFGWQWQTFPQVNTPDAEREQFLDWVAPLAESDFREAVVLDAGCGMGRWAEVVARFGARDLLAIDLSSSVDAAFERLRHLDNVHVVQGNILSLPLRRGPRANVDLAYSIGVLHHMPDPGGGFVGMARHVRPGGIAQAWFYGAEGNEWVERFVSPVRRNLTSRLPKPVLFGLSLGLALPLHAAVRTVQGAHLSDRIPYGNYLAWLGKYPFRHTHHVVFDHLAPSIAFYLTREQVEACAHRASLRNIEITPRNANSWRLHGRVP